MSHTPLFQVMFALQNAPVQAIELPELKLIPVDTQKGTSIFDVTLSVAEGPDGLSGTLEYNTDLFDAATICRMVEHFRTLLEGVVADPELPITALPLLTPSDSQDLLTNWNDSAANYPQSQCVQEAFEHQVGRTPEAIAVVSGDERLSYQELNWRANQLAHHLQALHVGADTLVGVSVERSLEMLVGVLGILKAGGAYLPLDPTYPEERLTFMLRDAQVAVLVTEEHHLQRFSSLPDRCATVCLDADWSAIAQESMDNPNSSSTRGDQRA
jgi:non-ribosomal peptide synthetase component F